MSFYYDYSNIVLKTPQSIHVWRQTDCTSIALNYYQNDMNFFKPQIHALVSDNKTTGYAVGEFPIIYYFTAIAYHIFGPNDIILKIINLLLFYLGLFALYKSALILFKSRFWALFVCILLFTSPIIVFYANNFLPNVPALSFVFLGWHQFILYYSRKKMSHLYYMFIFFTMAGLLKITALLTFVPLIIIMFLEGLGVLKKMQIHSNIIIKPWQTICLILIHIITIMSWYSYAISYNAKHLSNYFSTQTRSIWELNDVDIQKVLDNISEIWKYEYFHLTTLYLFLAIFIIIIIRFKKQNLFFSYMNMTMGCGVILYFLLWFFAFKNHDYYFIEIIPFFIFLLVSFLTFVKQFYLKWFNSKVVKFCLLIFLLFNINYAKNKIMYRYASNSWMNQHGNKTALWDIKEDLVEIGFEKKDKIISIPDPSPNHTLYALNQPGWTDLYESASSIDKINELIKMGAKYLIVNDTTIFQHRIYLREFADDIIYEKNGVQIFDLSSSE